MKRILILASALFAALPSALAQTPSPEKPIPFAVSTVKPAQGTGGTRFFFTPSGISIENISLQAIILIANDLQQDQIANVPAWAKDTRYDIEAKVDDQDREAFKSVKQPERRAMVESLLADRFHLKTHTETRDLPVLALIVAKGGLKITPTPTVEDAKPHNRGLYFEGRSVLHANDCPLALLANVLGTVTHHLVVDRTALPAHYDFTLKFSPDDAPADPNSAAPTLYTALQEQLGLRLDATKAPMPVLVVDSIDQPTPD